MRVLYHPSSSEIRLTSILYALSDPTRLEVVRCLANNGEQTCSDIGIPIAKSTLSHHFKVLREAGIIQARVEGTLRHVSLRKQDIETRFPGLLDAILNASGPY